MKVEAPPHPLPIAWQRALANDIAERLARGGWEPSDKLYAYHPTGNPSGHHYSSPGAFPSVLPSTELVSRDLYVWGTVAPEQYPGMNIPALAYALAQLDLAAAITKHDNYPDLIAAAQGWLTKARNTPRAHKTSPHVYRLKANRHGNKRLQRSDYALPIEADVFTIAANAAEVACIPDDDYAEALHDPDFHATAALATLERAMRYTLQAECGTVVTALCQ